LWVDPLSVSARLKDAEEFTFFESGVKASEQKTLQVLELDPNFVPALLWYGKVRWLVDGRLAEASRSSSMPSRSIRRIHWRVTPP